MPNDRRRPKVDVIEWKSRIISIAISMIQMYLV
jgi:hypothetical protein